MEKDILKPYMIQTNSGDRKVFHAFSLDHAKLQARKYFKTTLVYQPFC